MMHARKAKRLAFRSVMRKLLACLCCVLLQYSILLGRLTVISILSMKKEFLVCRAVPASSYLLRLIDHYQYPFKYRVLLDAINTYSVNICFVFCYQEKWKTASKKYISCDLSCCVLLPKNKQGPESENMIADNAREWCDRQTDSDCSSATIYS